MRTRDVLSFAALAFATLPGVASAGTVSTSPSSGMADETPVRDVRYVAAPGEPNSVELEAEPGRVVLRDSAGVTAGAGCVPGPDAATAVCALDRLGDVSITLADGDDRIGSTPGASLSVDGGAGNDVLEPGFGAVRGGAGDDVLMGNVVDGGFGADVLRGTRSPDDRVTYGDRTAPVQVDLDAEADDGEAGEGDTVEASIEEVLGGAGNDRLVGSATLRPGGDPPAMPRVLLAGGGGADQLVAGPAGARLRGGLGADVVTGGAGRDELAGGEDADVLDGGGGDDELVGGPGRDRMAGGDGTDRLVGDLDGADVRTRDGERDLVTCGQAPDVGRVARTAPGTATVDAEDLVRGCKRVRRGGRGAPRILVLGQAREDADGVIRAGIACSQDQRGGCRGSLVLRLAGRDVVEVAVRVRAGAAALVKARLPARALRGRDCEESEGEIVLSARDTRGGAFIREGELQLAAPARGCGNAFLDADGPDTGW